MATAVFGEAEDILVYYSGTGELNPPQAYKPSKLTYQDASNGVFLVTLNDPKRLNCMSMNLAQELTLVIEHIARDDRCKVVVWTGAGRAFCAGGNFTDSKSTVPADVYAGYIHAGIALELPDISLAAATRAMIKLPKLSIAAVNGITVGGGVNLAFVWQDFVYVGQDIKFRYPFGELGLTPELGSSWLLPRMVGMTRAKQLMQLGTEFTAQRAYELGLCTEVVAMPDVLAKAFEAAQKLAAMPQPALRESKRLVNKELVESIDKVTADEYNTLRKIIATPETQAAMMALMAKTSKSKL